MQLIRCCRAFNAKGEGIPLQEVPFHRLSPFPRSFPFQSGSHKMLSRISIPYWVDKVLGPNMFLRVGSGVILRIHSSLVLEHPTLAP